MLPEEIRTRLQERIAAKKHPRELAVDVMYEVQRHYGYMSDEALHEAAGLLGLSDLELEELATFYDFIYRQPVGCYIIHVCDGVVCWMFEEESILAYLCKRLGVEPGETTDDGMFTVLPTACPGFCDHAPAMVVNGRLYGPLDPETIDRILAELRSQPYAPVLCR